MLAAVPEVESLVAAAKVGVRIVTEDDRRMPEKRQHVVVA